MENILKKIVFLVICLIASPAMAIVESATQVTPTSELNPITLFFILLIVCIAIGIFAVLAGVGGGVIFTPLMMGFTSIDSFVIRSTGLFVAMVGALVVAKPFLRKGIANIKMLFYGAVPYTVFAIIGALLAGYIKATMGIQGEVFIRGALGIIVIGIGLLFVFAGKKAEYPEVKEVDSFTERLGLAMGYWEDSLGKVVNYKVKRAHIGAILFAGVGLISGLFGLGAGWAMVPVFNLVMLAPLKVAATCSKVMIGIGDTGAIWPYIMGGGILPLFAVPCMIGLIVGSLIGAKLMLVVKAGFIRYLVIIIMFGTGIRLVMKAIEMWPK
ncbi:MAG: sulfite exporter TauE/SafE family protein [bacterium]|nr:sulfite exporter TauE/SafE family protein [bacterium]